MTGSKIPPIDPLRYLLFKILNSRIAQEETEETEGLRAASSTPHLNLNRKIADLNEGAAWMHGRSQNTRSTRKMRELRITFKSPAE
jgi:hypothetical protein